MDLLSISTRNDLVWLNEPKEWSFIGETGIAIMAPSSSDFFCDPAAVNVKHSAPFLYKEFHGDFQITTKTSVDMVSQYDSSCLMFRLDTENWAKLCFEFDGITPSIVSVVTRNGLSDDCNHFSIDGRDIYLRITKSGNVISMFFSKDDISWKLVRYFGFEIQSQLQIGIVVQSPIGSGTQAHFDYLDLTEPPVQNRFS